MPAKLCSQCTDRPAKKGGSYCAPCHAAYMREWRRRRREEFEREMAELARLRAAQIARRRPSPGLSRLASKYADR